MREKPTFNRLENQGGEVRELKKSKFTQRTESTPVPAGHGMLKLLVCGAAGILVSLQCGSKSRDILEEDRSFSKASRYSSKKKGINGKFEANASKRQLAY